MAIVSSHISSAGAKLATPAFARTMSSRPSCRTASSTQPSWRGVADVVLGRHDPPSPSPASRTVSARSSGVAIP